MDKYAKLAEMLRSIVSENISMPVLIPARVQKITGETCTVLIGELTLTDIRLKAIISEDKDKILISPKVGSYVLLGSLSGDLRDLAVVKVDQVEKMEYQQDNLKINIDPKTITYENEDLKFSIDATDQKVSVQNGTTSLFDLFSQLTELLKNLKVYTPTGPSGTPLPDTITSIVKFENNFKALLK